jgi:hypothetical protein
MADVLMGTVGVSSPISSDTTRVSLGRRSASTNRLGDELTEHHAASERPRRTDEVPFEQLEKAKGQT